MTSIYRRELFEVILRNPMRNQYKLREIFIKLSLLLMPSYKLAC